MMLRWGGTRARPRIQAAINRLIARLGGRAPSTLHNHTALAGAFGERTLDAIIGLIDSGHREALRQEIVNEYDAIVREEREGGANNMGDDGRVDALRNLRLPPIGSGP